MRIERVHAHAFGPFVDEQLELAPGLTVVHGGNEAGKSTWHAALYAGLCGIRRGPGLRAVDREFRDRHAPWDDDRWEVGVTIALADGRRVELRHDLHGRVDSVARELGTGRDISADIMEEGAPDAARFLGLDRRTLPTTICVRQADVLGIVEDPDALQHHLQRAASTAGSDATVEEALRRIRDFHAEQVGLERRNSTRPLQRAIDRLAAAEAALDEARASHDDYLDLLGETESAQRRAADAARRAAAAREVLDRRELATLEQRLERARELDREVPDDLPPAEDDREFVRLVGDALHALEHRPPAPQAPESPSADELAAELEALPQPPEGETEVHPEVEAVVTEWRDALRVAEEHAGVRPDAEEGDLPPIPAAELRRLAEDLETPVPEVDQELEARFTEAQAQADGRGPAPLIGAGGVVMGLVGLTLLVTGQVVVGPLLLTIGAVVAVVALLTGRTDRPSAHEVAQLGARLTLQQETREHAETRRRAAVARLRDAGVDADPAGVRRLARRVEDAERHGEREREWRTRADTLDRRCADAAAALRRALEERGVEIPGDEREALDAAITTYREACRGRATQARLASRRDDLAAALQARRSLEDAAAADRAARAEAVREARVAADRIGSGLSETATAGELADVLRGWLERHDAEDSARQRLREAAAALREVLDGRSIEQLEAEVERRRRMLAAATDRESADIDADELLDADGDLGEQVRRLEEDARQAGEDAAKLRGRVADREVGMPSVAEAEEAHLQAVAELTRVRRLDATLQRTREFLQEARDRVQRDIAPRLSAAVSDRLARVTDGRYTEVTVDPADLDVHVRATGGRWRRAALLSHGTAEQVYLLLRVAMAEHIITTAEPAPLLLDDVTVQADDDRTGAFLDLLIELSTDRQVVLFSQEGVVADWAADRLDAPEHRLVELDPTRVSP